MAQLPLPPATLSGQSERETPVSLDGPSAGSGNGQPLRLFMTSDVRAATGLSRTHLDFYIREGLVRPAARTESGFLLFDEPEVMLLRDIVSQRQAGISLREIRQRIDR